jgi:hypothetical protein
MYHSSATLLPDGSVWISGSNPNADVSTKHWATEYRVEIFYPPYYNKPRPAPTGLPTNLTYGGNYFKLTLSSSDLGGNMSSINTASVYVIRTGYSTHGVNWNMRSLQLNSTFDATGLSSGTLYVSQMPPNPNLFAPGPALIFVNVNGVPSVGQWVTVGSGSIGTQGTKATQMLPANKTRSLLRHRTFSHNHQLF